MINYRKLLGYGLAIWIAFGAMLTAQVYLHRRAYGEPASMRAAAVIAISDIVLWAVMAALAFLAARWVSVERFSARQIVVIHLFVGPAVVLFRSLLDLPAVYLITGEMPQLKERILLTFTLRLMTFYAFLGAGYAVEYVRRYHERELRETQLREQLVRAQLSMLKMQLQPHFLFNTLHAVSSLMLEDVWAADRMLSRLAEMLRQALQSSQTQMVTLAEEIEGLEPYLEIERIRFGNRLRVTVDLGGCEDALVPHMLLQPLVENAIRHGIAPSEAGGALCIEARRRDGLLQLQVRDTGSGLGSASAGGHGLGLTNTRQRLQYLYGDRHSLELRSGTGGRGVSVLMELPYASGTTASIPQHAASPGAVRSTTDGGLDRSRVDA
jgi:signal transduction histidine kinase